jgi:peptidoglycan pentaglycine glycine transferase (the first glycine)
MGPSAKRLETPPVSEAEDYSVRFSDSPDDPAWDDFLERFPVGHQSQTSCWGRARGTIGWRPIRLVVSRDGTIVGGAQMVTRPMPAFGNVGFVHCGPAVPDDSPGLIELVFAEMLAMGRSRDVQYLVVQPPPGCDWLRGALAAFGFRDGALDMDDAYVRLDLGPDLGRLFAGMPRQCRQNIRTAEKHGVTVRRGSEADLPIFNRLKDAHCARLGYARRPEGYYAELWRALRPRGHIQLFVAEVEAQPVSAMLSIPFGDTCCNMERPWSGEHGNLRPNELLEWEVIKWAKSEGFRFVDHGAVPREFADAILSGKEVPEGPACSASMFKLKFGGSIVIDPPSYDYVYNPVLRLAYRCVPLPVMRSAWMQGRISNFKNTGT